MARKSRKNQNLLLTNNAVKSYAVGVYTRISIMDKEKNNSIDNQKYILEKYMENKPYLKIFDYYVDNGKTGTNMERSDFQRMIEDIKLRKINCIIVKDLSRFGRNYIDVGNYIETVFPFLGVRFISVNDNYDSQTAGGDEAIPLSLKMLADDFYAKELSQKVSAAYALKKKKGDFGGGVVTYGYVKSAENNQKLEIDEDVSHIIKMIFQMAVDGDSYSKICKKLNQLKIPTPNNYKYSKGFLTSEINEKKFYWIPSVIRKILENRIYTGDMVGNIFDGSKAFNRKITKKPKDQWIIVENTHEPIIDKIIFDKVQGLVEEKRLINIKNRDKNKDIITTENIFKKLIFCGDCATPMSRIRKINKSKSTRIATYQYKCRSYETGNFDKCNIKKNIDETDLINVVSNAIFSQIDVLTDIEKLVEKLVTSDKMKNKNMEVIKEIANINKKIKNISVRQRGLYCDYDDKILDGNEYLFAKNNYEIEKNNYIKKLDELVEKQVYFDTSFVTENKYVKAFNNIKNSRELSREILVEIVEKIEITNYDQVFITFKYVDEFEKIKKFIGESEVL